MKIPPKDIARFIKEAHQKVQAVLVYGPDRGLVATRKKQLIQTVVEDSNDPFLVSMVNGISVKDTPVSLYEHLTQGSLFAGRRVVVLDDMPATLPKSIMLQTDSLHYPAFFIITAGDLGPKNPIRMLFEKATTKATIPCYHDEEREVRGMVVGQLNKRHITYDHDVIDYIAHHVAGDRLVVASEIGKLLLYIGEATHVSIEDVKSIIAHTEPVSLNEVGSAFANKELVILEGLIERLLQENIPAVTIIRVIARHMLRLYQVMAVISEGVAVDIAMKQLRPPVFFKEAPAFKQALNKWRVSQVEQALEGLFQLEFHVKQSGSDPDLRLKHAMVEMIGAV